MAIRIKTGVSPVWFVPKSQESEEQPARFRLKPLTGGDLLDVQGEIDIERDTVTGKGLKFLIKKGLVGWEQIEDENGRALACSGPAALLYLDQSILTELASKIMEISTFREDQAKN